MEIIVATGQTGDAVEQDNHVLAEFDQTLGPFDDEFRQLRVPLRRLVEGRAVDVGLNRAPQISDLFRALVDEKKNEPDLGRSGADRLGDVLHQDGLAGAGRSYDEGPLPFAERRDEIDRARAQGWFFGRLEQDALLREKRGQFVKRSRRLPFGRRNSLDGGNLLHSAITIPLVGGTQSAGHLEAGLQVEIADQTDGDKEVVGTFGHVVARPADHGMVSHVVDQTFRLDDCAGGEEKAAEVRHEVSSGAVGA